MRIGGAGANVVGLRHTNRIQAILRPPHEANQLARAESVAARRLGFEAFPAFAEDQLRVLLQSIRNEQVRDDAGVRFAPEKRGPISMHGGEIVSGGAPLDLIAGTVKTVKSLIFGGRTARGT